MEFVPANPGDNVTVPVPLVDRGRSDPRNLLGIILDRDENDLYRIAVRAGILKGKYARNQFDLCVQRLLFENDVKNNVEVSLRCAVQAESNCGGQGYVKCNCVGSNRCQSKRCKCFKNKMKCNSRCHSCLSCDNKQQIEITSTRVVHTCKIVHKQIIIISICQLISNLSVNF